VQHRQVLVEQELLIGRHHQLKQVHFTAASGEGYFVNTAGGAFEMDLPAGVSWCNSICTRL